MNHIIISISREYQLITSTVTSKKMTDKRAAVVTRLNAKTQRRSVFSIDKQQALESALGRRKTRRHFLFVSYQSAASGNLNRSSVNDSTHSFAGRFADFADWLQ